ncbi:cytochrome b561 and DOMON domain-containing protein At5g47530-like [Corylus avellana]|uniref:cytochrome b561 and DOMON domain-containing protein At5g47530-like n=1 Tax=Corylus avellana TaxID=13451 RepID=UPI001E206CC5|nr:cytochrome b561 and DOMON domain-containing protein At5g47530-like [Corylus avellana]
MGKGLTTLLLSCVLFSLCASSFAQTCKSYNFSSSNRVYSSCTDLPVLSSFLHWSYDQSTNKVEIAYRHTGASTSNWVAWAINPSGQGMVGAQALVAYQNSSSAIHAYTSPVSGYGTTLAEGSLSFAVSNLSATFENSEMTIFATLTLDSSMTTVNQVWQEGPLSGGSPSSHDTTSNSANMQSAGTLNFLNDQATTTSAGGVVTARRRRQNVHGVLNAVSWGTLMPMGAMIARYLKVFKSADPAWFYLHIACQTSAYVIGVAGWATGLKLGSEASSVNQYDTHRNIGITLFCLGSLQVFALLLRPKKDHKYRLYWNIYHHSVGYSVIILSIINIFKGLDILDPEKKWKRIYSGILIFLGVVAALLEAFTWFIVIKRKQKSSVNYPEYGNGVNGTNSYAARTENGV